MESPRRQYQWTALGPVVGRLQLGLRRGESMTDATSREALAFDHYFPVDSYRAEVGRPV
jgi:hypothetical protein